MSSNQWPQRSNGLFLCVAGIVVLLTACTALPTANIRESAKITNSSEVTQQLNQLPKPQQKIVVAVYGFRDQTGQYKPSAESGNSNSVTQGAASILVKALHDSGWYIPVEREGLANLLTERKIIRAIESPLEKGKPAINLPSLLPAVLNFEGGVIAYESNVKTGGKGANYLGIGSHDSYRVDQVTVSLRAINVKTGEIMDTVSVTKTIYSYQFAASIYAFVSYQKLLQLEKGFTTNEPAQLAVREAIESAVIHLIAQGVKNQYLLLRNPSELYSPILQKYLREVANTTKLGISPETKSSGLPFIEFNMMADKNPLAYEPLLNESAVKGNK